MITSVRLVSWRSHKDTLLEFRPGTNLLVGIMGAGKSSVMEAISFSLFGTFPALERRKLKLENVVRLNEPLAKVMLEFVWEGAPYRIERTIERSKKGVATHAEIYKNGAIIEHGPSGVNTCVSSLLGIDYDLFTRAIYSEQNNIDHFLNLGPGKRKEEMDLLLGLDRFETARGNIVTVINRVRSKRQALEEQFSREKLAETEMKEAKMSGENSALRASLGEVAEAALAGAKEALAASARFDAILKSREEHERLSLDEARISARLESLRKELEGKSVDEPAIARLEEKLRALGELRAKLDASAKSADARLSALSKESGSADAGLKSAESAKTRLDAVSAELSSILGASTAEALANQQKEAAHVLLGAESERKALEREIAEMADSVLRLRPGLSECPLCSSKLTDDGITHVRAEKERLVAEKKARIAELGAQMPEKRKASEGMLARLGRAALLTDKRATLAKEAAGLEDLKAKRAEVESKLAAAMKERSEILEKTDLVSREAEGVRAQLVLQKSLLARRAEADMAAKKSNDTKAAIAALAFDLKSFENLRLMAESARIGAERLQSSKKSLETQLRLSDEMLALVRGELASMKRAAEAVRALAELEEQLAIYKNALLETQTSLRYNLADAINAAMNEVWPVFYPYRNYRALRLGVSEKDYVFEVDDGASGWKALETVASGGERACAALALRVALAMVLTPKLGWLILDEPTHNLDAEAVEMLSSALEFKVPEVVNQTFLITHDEAFMGSEFASSYRLGRDKEHNGETKAEAM
ncbi:SMC family ATPase [Candidatus Micrarchaeota archaeon]|nr:SMC family ATPase [Candidatus Micrarchaeota archaeon]